MRAQGEPGGACCGEDAGDDHQGLRLAVIRDLDHGELHGALRISRPVCGDKAALVDVLGWASSSKGSFCASSGLVRILAHESRSRIHGDF